jgi:predicted O-methyltransferase YrrM
MMADRYLQLHEAVRKKQPKAILEVGTWNGERAVNLLNLCPTAKYYGFDLFEDATKQTDEEEFNVKRHHFKADVLQRLDGFDVELFKGNTRETLKHFDRPVDFVWIDGGHSIETIRSDWENVKRCLTPDAWVFFDDYFSGGGIDTTKMGCNSLVHELKHEVLPVKDWVVGDGRTQIVRVFP